MYKIRNCTKDNKGKKEKEINLSLLQPLLLDATFHVKPVEI